jgi:poly-gamma-glutamate synthesis protein (capsule biosynthesis protein)
MRKEGGEMMEDVLTVLAVGDVGPDREKPESIFELAGPVIQEADVRFCQLERILSSRGSLQVQIRNHHSRVDPKNVSALTFAGFDVVSFASNHSLDWGREGFLDTIDLVKTEGMKVLGAGRDIAEARKPVILEKKGVRIAFLGYCTVLPKGWEAGPSVPGCAPLRARTFYEQIDWQAGTPPRIITTTLAEDLEAMVADIRNARSQADVVLLSIHWGVHFLPAVIADYQREAGHAAIEAGADAILGHHAHILKGVEVYKGKPIFYSLGNFAFDVPARFVLDDPGYQQMRQRYPWEVDPEYVGYGYPVDSRKTLIVKCRIERKGIVRVSFLPALINKHAQPEVLKSGDNRFYEVVEYMRSVSQSQKLKVTLTPEGDEVIVS